MQLPSTPPAVSTRLPALAGLALALALLTGAVPYTLAWAQVMLFPSDEDSWRRAGRLSSDPRLQEEGLLRNITAAQLNPATTPADWKGIAASCRALLALRPIDPATWARLAYAEVQAEDRDAARAALAHSFDNGFYLPAFQRWRYVLALTLWPDMDEAQRHQVADQTGLLWRKKRWDLVRMSRLAPFAASVEEIMQRYYPDQAGEFLRLRRPLKTY